MGFYGKKVFTKIVFVRMQCTSQVRDTKTLCTKYGVVSCFVIAKYAL